MRPMGRSEYLTISPSTAAFAPPSASSTLHYPSKNANVGERSSRARSVSALASSCYEPSEVESTNEEPLRQK
ncbi:hypothetical protein ON010_g16788 [Phytophthora cinnamomi]|nr:hypothetical protein ON010_g16788 [Phytophthora cinnamomi]